MSWSLVVVLSLVIGVRRFGVCRVSFVVCCLLVVVCGLLCVVRWWLRVVCCLLVWLCVVCSVVFDVGSLLCVSCSSFVVRCCSLFVVVC